MSVIMVLSPAVAVVIDCGIASSRSGDYGVTSCRSGDYVVLPPVGVIIGVSPPAGVVTMVLPSVGVVIFVSPPLGVVIVVSPPPRKLVKLVVWPPAKVARDPLGVDGIGHCHVVSRAMIVDSEIEESSV